MNNTVNFFVLEEEHTIGFATIGDKEVFVTEESVRFDAPLIKIHESLEDAVKCICGPCYDEDEINDFRESLANAYSKYKDVKKATLLKSFLNKMDKMFSHYKEDDIMTSYKYDRVARYMWVSKEDYDIDHGYMWSALDGAVALWNMEHSPYCISVDEDAPDKDGMIRYTFEIEELGTDYED